MSSKNESRRSLRATRLLLVLLGQVCLLGLITLNSGAFGNTTTKQPHSSHNATTTTTTSTTAAPDTTDSAATTNSTTVKPEDSSRHGTGSSRHNDGSSRHHDGSSRHNDGSSRHHEGSSRHDGSSRGSMNFHGNFHGGMSRAGDSDANPKILVTLKDAKAKATFKSTSGARERGTNQLVLSAAAQPSLDELDDDVEGAVSLDAPRDKVKRKAEAAKVELMKDPKSLNDLLKWLDAIISDESPVPFKDKQELSELLIIFAIVSQVKDLADTTTMKPVRIPITVKPTKASNKKPTKTTTKKSSKTTANTTKKPAAGDYKLSQWGEITVDRILHLIVTLKTLKVDFKREITKSDWKILTSHVDLAAMKRKDFALKSVKERQMHEKVLQILRRKLEKMREDRIKQLDLEPNEERQNVRSCIDKLAIVYEFLENRDRDGKFYNETLTKTERDFVSKYIDIKRASMIVPDKADPKVAKIGNGIVAKIKSVTEKRPITKAKLNETRIPGLAAIQCITSVFECNSLLDKNGKFKPANLSKEEVEMFKKVVDPKKRTVTLPKFSKQEDLDKFVNMFKGIDMKFMKLLKTMIDERLKHMKSTKKPKQTKGSNTTKRRKNRLMKDMDKQSEQEVVMNKKVFAIVKSQAGDLKIRSLTPNEMAETVRQYLGNRQDQVSELEDKGKITISKANSITLSPGTYTFPSEVRMAGIWF